jgi:TolB protein
MLHDEQMLEPFGGRLAVLSNFAGQVVESDLAYTPIGFQAPAWSPEGDRALVAVQADDPDDGNRLALVDQSGEITDEITGFDSLANFSWSPDGEYIAYVAADDPTGQNRLGGLNVVGVEGDEFHLASEEEEVFAYFWSPDSSKIAYFILTPVPDEETGEDVLFFRLNVLTVPDGEVTELGAFVPTQEMTLLLQFFDMYQRSMTIWSPNSENLVVSALLQGENPAVLVLDSSGQFDPRLVGNGIVAYWSPK